MKPDLARKMRYIELEIIEIANQYGYSEVRFPHLESSQLFEKSIGIETDVVGQEMYQFTDKNNESVSLRPEGTASCLRSSIHNSLIPRQKQKLFYLGQMFRRERPQKGRYREFTQFGLEAFGYPTGLIDVEMIMITDQIWKKLGIQQPTLVINYLGALDTRQRYRNLLCEYWAQHASVLNEDEKARATQNPLRLLDSKNPALTEIIQNAPSLLDQLTNEEQLCFQKIQSQLTSSDIQFVISSKLVRGLDYYSDFVFEWISDDLGAQGTICGGGRYDLLCQNMGCDTPATGLAIGVDRLALLVDKSFIPKTNVVICSEDAILLEEHYHLVESIRQVTAYPIHIDFHAKKIKKIHSAKDKGFSHTVILSQNSFKIVDHAHSSINEHELTKITTVLKNLETSNAAS
jgi:histidyl-tRNA synthetase